MLVCLVNRILKLLDNNTDPTAVIAAMVDWTSAFDRQDPTLGIQNFLKINVFKTKFMIITRTKTDFTTRLIVNGQKIDQVTKQKVCGVWITDDLKWEKNSRELAKGAFTRMSMLTKLKYVGVCQSDLLDVYRLFIRSVLEYCLVVWHSRLTVEDKNILERVQKTSLRIILGDSYENYPSALEACNIKPLDERREERSLKFDHKCLKHPVNKRLFPINTICHDLHE